MIASNTARLVLTRYSLLPVNIATGILIARVLGPAALGMYTLMLWLPSVLAGPLSLGLGNANLYFAAREPALTRPLVANSVLVSILGSALVLGLVLAALRTFPSFVPAGLGTLEIMVPLMDLPLRILNMYGANIFNALKQHAVYRRCEVIQTFAYATAAFAAVFVLDMTLWGFVLSQIIATAATSIYILTILSRNGHFSFRPDLGLLRKSITYGAKIQLGSILRVGGQKADEILLFHFSGASALGILTLGRNLANRIRVVPVSLGTILVPELAQSGNAPQDLVTSAIRRLLVLMSVIVAAAILLAELLVPLIYGSEFRDAVTPLQILLLALIPLSVQRMLVMYLVATGRASQFVQMATLGFLVILTLDLVLIPVIGIYGAVISALFGALAEMLFALRIFTRLTGSRSTEILRPRRTDASALWKSAMSLVSR
ncbi:hypothetical protein SVA_1471 [Sulfurifustis variabilis]|uniref:Uncharacterized protein n=1 Tax=Sulfurifustis variabilis TaxID=1675686 RepID=A0A1B4V3A7_9GAMM|nr:polysaccharide biosynthesis C-terminal domain-containing protein [Sulfurifustis variabilis]BAU48033.1 hypothetical protein SVA_1471 [Sulfurifustis variabilis]